MIKFFRNIRQKLLAEGKISNYLKYGIGEIILVVIGIMIAIQANNWNVERVAQKELAFSLNKLIVNLEQDVESLHKEMDGNKTIISNLDSCLIILKSPDKYTKSYFLKLFFPINRVAEFNSNKVSFNNLTASGKFQSIRNEALIDSLFHYYNSEPYKPVENAIINHTRDVIRPYLMGFDFIPIHQDPLKSHDDEKSFYTSPKSLMDYAMDLRIINGLRFKIFLHSRLDKQYKLKMEESKSIIRQIKNELKDGYQKI